MDSSTFWAVDTTLLKIDYSFLSMTHQEFDKDECRAHHVMSFMWGGYNTNFVAKLNSYALVTSHYTERLSGLFGVSRALRNANFSVCLVGAVMDYATDWEAPTKIHLLPSEPVYSDVTICALRASPDKLKQRTHMIFPELNCWTEVISAGVLTEFDEDLYVRLAEMMANKWSCERQWPENY